MSTWRIDLPWTTPPLTENKQPKNIYAKARIVKEIRARVCWHAYDAHVPKGLGRVIITLHWLPRTKRPRDTNAGTPTLKALIDGLVTDYGLCVDDTREHVEPRCVIYDHDPRPHVALWLTIEEATE